MTKLDTSAIRRDFPILARSVNGHPLAYLDSAASSQKPRPVLEAMRTYYENHHANVHRGAHQLSVEATESFEAARAKVAAFLHAAEARSVVFTRNATEALNLVVRSWGTANLTEGDEVLVTVAEHHANLVPWHLLRDERGFTLRAVGLTSEQRVDMDAFAAAINERTRAVATFHMSNVLGAINDVRRMADLAHAVGAVMIVDGAQGAPHLPVDVQAMGCDFYVLSAHKMLGPTGAGALWARASLLDAMPPFLGGGEMIRNVSVQHSTYADIPHRFEAGTPNIAEAIGLGAAIDYLQAIGMDAIADHDRALTAYALERMKPLEGVSLYGPEGEDRGGIVSFNIDGVHAHDVASALDAEGIAVRSGQHCAQPLHDAFGTAASARASFYLYTTEEEIDRLVAGIVRIRDFFGAYA